MTRLLLPRLGETMEQGRVVAWLKSPGDAFVRGETIVEIETDKTVVELPALADGVLRRIDAETGTDVDVGGVLGEYEPIGGEADVAPEDDAQPAAAVDEVGATGAAAAPTAAAPAAKEPAAAGSASVRSDASTAPGERVRAAPNARRLARRHGVDLAALTGSGPRSRIQGRDVMRAAGAPDGGAPSSIPATETAAPVQWQTVPGGRLAYREWRGAGAHGAPLVLLHGFGGDGQAWAALASRLQRAGRRVIAPDLPSHGETGFDAADPAALAEAIVALIDRLDLAPVELVGHSLGAAVAARVGALLGARAGRTTLIAPLGLGSEIDADFLDGMAHAAHGGALVHLLRRVALNPPTLSAAQLEQMAAAIRTRGALAPLAARMANGGRQQIDIGPELAALEGRVRVVWGLEDRIIPWHHAVHAGPAVPVFFIPQAGHMPQWDQPHRVAALFV